MDKCEMYRAAMLFCAFVAFICGWGCWAAWSEGFASGKRRARRDGFGIDHKEFIAALTKHLDIQADGGDSPEDFVRWALREAQKEHRENGHSF